MKNETETIKGFLSNENIREFVIPNLKSSLSSMGYSEELIGDLIVQLEKGDFKSFQEKYIHELKNVHSIGFFHKMVPKYFGKEVVPFIPDSNTILDIGCGTGILVDILSRSGKFDKIVGMDINSYPEWSEFSDRNVELKVVKEEGFEEFLKELNPDTIVLTWTLHHMTFEEQKRYLERINSILDNVTIVALEDSFSEELDPQEDIGVFESFSKLNFEEKMGAMSVFDWVANRILERRDKIPIPFGYRTLEGWQELFEKEGFSLVKRRYIGFPENRDVNTPQGLIVVEKK